MNGNDLQLLETWVRDANPVPHPRQLVGSEEAASVTRLLSQAPEMDVPGLLPASPAALGGLHDEDALERGRDMDTMERTHLRDHHRPPAGDRRRRWRTVAVGFAAVVVIGALGGIIANILETNDPTPPAADAAVEIVFNDPDGKLAAHAATITGLIEETNALAAKVIDVEGVRVTVSPDIPGAIAPDFGVGWSYADIDSVVIAIDPWHPELDEVLAERLPSMVASALYDLARVRTIDTSAPPTLLDELVIAGLRDHFAEELLGTPPFPWSNAFPETQTQAIMDEARPLLDTSDFSYSDWFFPGTTEIPQWAGYTLGHRMIETYLAENPDQTAADLVSTPTFVFRPLASPGGD
ncbi:MAG: DUF2268 domain-containing putative Zn-dependent protease [Acidimicrobiia bacterium]|nr:DUF2268 domain-containing putative Zn-dependent protease [Acidimicrobiia bacterium]